MMLRWILSCRRAPTAARLLETTTVRVRHFLRTSRFRPYRLVNAFVIAAVDITDYTSDDEDDDNYDREGKQGRPFRILVI
ncbi:hypothetical protein KIN20_007054 [Parelaphostrongylus tenuis]|uniref:Uncharacterized protein n=1 Tax=Parelaphostrongylus tenuis TaxID=148309 RepID=A0AAD5QGI7_PARTN|nr:hypothetical protein KIN20_007054 [Parelaphostrongylus tenuis]